VYVRFFSYFSCFFSFSLLVGFLSLLVGSEPRRSAAVPVPAGQTPGYRVLAYSRTTGFRHDAIPDAVAAVQQLGQANGFQVDATEDPSVFDDDATLAGYRAVIFLLTTGDVLDPAGRAAFERYIRAGGGYVGVHSAADTEYDWPFYGELLGAGAYFASHPDIQTAVVQVEDAALGLPEAWVRTDEWYNFRRNPRPSVQVQVRLDEGSYAGGDMGDDHPITWYHTVEGGRAWYTGMGHTRQSYAEPLFLRHLLAGIQYAAGILPTPESQGS
jgi:type 1 glutamine amidotransferase